MLPFVGQAFPVELAVGWPTPSSSPVGDSSLVATAEHIAVVLWFVAAGFLGAI